jgi:hypothetical protein
VGADDRPLRDRLERAQVRTKTLRAHLADPRRLEVLRTEVREQLERLRAESAVVAGRLTVLKTQVEEARIDSMREKRERSERNPTRHVGATGRVAFAISATLGAAIAGVHFGDGSSLHLPGAVMCAVGAAGFIGWVWKTGRDLSGR